MSIFSKEVKGSTPSGREIPIIARFELSTDKAVNNLATLEARRPAQIAISNTHEWPSAASVIDKLVGMPESYRTNSQELVNVIKPKPVEATNVTVPTVDGLDISKIRYDLAAIFDASQSNNNNVVEFPGQTDMGGGAGAVTQKAA